MSRRHPLGELWRRLVSRVLPADPESRAAVVIAVGTALAVVSILLAGFVPRTQFLVDTLYSLAVLFPLVGAAIVVGALWWISGANRSSRSSLRADESPEVGSTRTVAPVGRETGWTLDSAARGRYRCQSNESSVEIRERLCEGAVRVVQRRDGRQAEAAREAVRSGAWTDDPVAAAFLADDVGYPIGERLRGAIDPGWAYQRRVSRTLDAIEALEDGSRPGPRRSAAPRPEADR